MRLCRAAVSFALPILFAAFALPAPASAQVEPTAENAITCASIYRYLGDTGPAYERLAAKNAELTGRTIDAVKADLDARDPRLRVGIADGRLQDADMVRVAGGACPQAFGVAPANRTATPVTASSKPAQPDPIRCAALFRWFDSKFPPNAWGSTWAGDEMIRRATRASGLDFDTVKDRSSGFSPATSAIAPLLDQAVECQQAYDTEVPPGAVIAAAQHGDRPGIERGRNAWCRALASDFDRSFPDIASAERSIARHPPSASEQVLETMKTLQWYLNSMGKAGCPSGFWEERVAAFEQFTTRATAAVNQAKQRAQSEGKWW